MPGHKEVGQAGQVEADNLLAASGAEGNPLPP
jgi:hypothetical protein